MHQPTMTLSDVMATLMVTVVSMASGDYGRILFGAVAGSIWALSGAQTATRVEGAVLVFKLAMTACALTGPLVYLIESHKLFPAAMALAPTAFFIAALGNRWVKVFDTLSEGLVSLVGLVVKVVGERLTRVIGGSK